MTSNWMTIRVQLEDGGTAEMRHPPGRLMLVGPHHTFRALADAINAAFARWDLSHLHEFELGDGRRIGLPDDEFDEPEYACLDDTTLTVTEVLTKGDEFTFVFDLGDYWLHRCTVEHDDADPADAYGPPPPKPVPIWGWGEIPDQYGRRWTDDTGEDDEDTEDEDVEWIDNPHPAHEER